MKFGNIYPTRTAIEVDSKPVGNAHTHAQTDGQPVNVIPPVPSIAWAPAYKSGVLNCSLAQTKQKQQQATVTHWIIAEVSLNFIQYFCPNVHMEHF